MEAQQCVKLSLTNRSIGLIPPPPCVSKRRNEYPSRPEINLQPLCKSKVAIPDSALPSGKARKGYSERQTQKTSIHPGLSPFCRKAKRLAARCFGKAKAAEDPAYPFNGSGLSPFCRKAKRLAAIAILPKGKTAEDRAWTTWWLWRGVKHPIPSRTRP